MREDNTSESVGSTITPSFVVENSNSKSFLALRLSRIDATVGETRLLCPRVSGAHDVSTH